jgi:competence protein ComEA
MWKDRFIALFNFSRHERRGVVALALILALAWMLPILSHRRSVFPAGTELNRMLQADSFQDQPSHIVRTTDPTESPFRKPRPTDVVYRPPAELRPFDPNTATEGDWIRMGLSSRQSRVIRNYVSKGGRFRRAEDLNRIFGFPRDAYKALAPYVRIPPPLKDFSHEAFSKEARRNRRPQWSHRPIPKVGINTADSITWESLPGIGPFLASRIVRFRERLGGFHSASQIAETYGLPDSVFQRIRPFLVEEPQRFSAGLEINTATFDQLRSHPYMNHRLARSIVAYREQHGRYRSIHDLLAIESLTPEVFEKLSPYLLIR